MRTASISLICASVLLANTAWAQAAPSSAASAPQAAPSPAPPSPASRVAKAPTQVAQAPATRAPAPPGARAAEPPPLDAPPPPTGESPPPPLVQAPPDIVGESVPPLDAPAAPPAPPPPQVVPAPGPTDSQAILNELSETEERIDDLRARRNQYPIGGPIAMMAIGYGGALVFGMAALATWASAEAIDRGLDDNDPDFDEFRRSDVNRARVASRIVGGISVLPLALGIAGSVVLTQRLEERRRFGPELRSLSLRRRALRRELRYGVNAGPHAAGLTLTASF